MTLRLTPDQQRLIDQQVHIIAVATELIDATKAVTSQLAAWVPSDRELERIAEAVQLEHDRLQFAISLYIGEKRKARRQASPAPALVDVVIDDAGRGAAA